MSIEQRHIEEAQKWDNLDPAYFAAQEIARRFMEHFEAEHFKPLVDKLADEFRDKLWRDIDGWLLGDTESNLTLAMSQMVDDTVRALLGGNEWALKRYALGARHDHGAIRAAVAKHIPAELQDARIADLEAEVDRLRKDLEWWRTRS